MLPEPGLGPVFNARACADCHQNPVSGGSSQFTEVRAGHNDANGNFVAATIPINDGANIIANRSIINDRALIPQAQEHIPDTEDIRALRAALNTLGAICNMARTPKGTVIRLCSAGVGASSPTCGTPRTTTTSI